MMQPFKFGVFDHMDDADRGLARQYEERVQLAAACEVAHFHAYHLAVAGETLDYHGRYFYLQNVPTSLSQVQLPHPPLWVGAVQPETGAWAADNAMNIACFGGAERVRAITDAYRARWRARAEPEGVMPLLGMVRQIVIADSDEAARALAAPAYQRWFDTFTHVSRQRGLPLPPSPPATFEEATRIGVSISGSAATVRRILTAQASDAGINYLLCQIAFGTLPLQASLRTASAIASEIMPHFAEASLDVVH